MILDSMYEISAIKDGNNCKVYKWFVDNCDEFVY